MVNKTRALVGITAIGMGLNKKLLLMRILLLVKSEAIIPRLLQFFCQAQYNSFRISGLKYFSRIC